jgi:hypothetical protein
MPRAADAVRRDAVGLGFLSLRDRLRLLGLAVAGVTLAGFLIGAQFFQPQRVLACGGAGKPACGAGSPVCDHAAPCRTVGALSR